MAYFIEVIDNKYELHHNITVGRGAFGWVYEGNVLGDETQKVAIKRIVEKQPKEYSEPRPGKTTLREIIPLKLNHPNIVQIYHFTSCDLIPSQAMIETDEKRVKWFIIMELCNANLTQYFKYRDPDMATKMNIMLQVSQGLQCLHKNQIMHRDMKPSNILICIGNNITAKISDYGHARIILEGEKSFTTSNLGTDDWRAPEFTDKNTHYSYPVDVFSLGHIFLALLTCKPEHCDYLCDHLRIFTGNGHHFIA
jgi:serine/threonine protein kinase